jgi:hypothetical protein
MLSKEPVLFLAKPLQRLSVTRTAAQVGEKLGDAPSPIEQLEVSRRHAGVSRFGRV